MSYQGRRTRKNSLPAAGRVMLRLGPATVGLVTQSHCEDAPKAMLPSRNVSAMVLGHDKVTWLPLRATLSCTGSPMTMVPLFVTEAVDTVEVTLQLYVPGSA